MAPSLGALPVLNDDILIRIFLEVSEREFLVMEQVCKHFRELLRDRDLCAAWLHKLPREQWPCIGPHETREGSDLRQVITRTLKTSRNWEAGCPTLSKRLHLTGHQDDFLRILPGGRYILTSSLRVITCVDALAKEDSCIIFRYILPSDSVATIHAIGLDMTGNNTVVIAVVLTHDDDWRRCMFIHLDLENYAHTFLNGSDQLQNMLVLPEHWIVKDISVKQDLVCLRMQMRPGRRDPRQHSIFLIDLQNMTGIFLWRSSHPRFRMPDQIAFSEGRTHLLLLMEVPVILSMPVPCLASLWEETRHNGGWTPHDLDYRACDQQIVLPNASHLFRSGNTELSVAITADMERAVRGRYLVRHMQVRKPSWLDTGRLQNTGFAMPFTLSLINAQVYSMVSNHIGVLFLHFIVDSRGARFSLEQQAYSFSNIEPKDLLCPTSRQGSFVSFWNQTPFASKMTAKGIQQVKLKNAMKGDRSWDIDFYCNTLSYITTDDDRQCIVNYDRYD